jgi:uncharacterized protein (DUF1697 family)
MTRHIAFLRAINVGGHTVKMERLRALFEELGYAEVETFIASGNVIFTATGNGDELRQAIESQLKAQLGYEVETFLRTPAEVAAVAACQPFPAEMLAEAPAQNVAFLHRGLTAAELERLESLKTAIDDFRAVDREVYWLCRVKQSESKFSNALFEKTLKLKATFRGRNTVEKLATKYPQ